MISQFCRVFLLVITYGHVLGQSIETYYHDTEGKELGRIFVTKRKGEFLYVGGHSYNTHYNEPTITKLTLEGEILWTTKSTHSPELTYEIKDILVTEDYVFGYSRNFLWKVNIETGIVEWKKPLATTGNETGQYLYDYNETTLLVRLPLYQSWPYNRYTEITFINKSDGVITQRHPTSPLSTTIDALAVDSKKNIYYVHQDTLVKISPVGSVLWKTTHKPSNVLSYQYIHIDADDNVFVFGNRNYTFRQAIVNRFDKDNGSFLWNYTSSLIYDVAYSTSMDIGSDVIVTWKHVYTGGYNIMLTHRLDKASGLPKWESELSFDAEKNEQAALAMEVDSDGNVLLTGYHNRVHDANGEWAFVKLDGNTGTSLAKVTLRDAIEIPNRISVGMGVYWHDNKICLIGMMETFSGPDVPFQNYRYAPLFMQLDPVTYEVTSKTYLYGNYEYPSRTIDIERIGDKKAILKQIGRFVYLSVYDKDNHLLWEKSIIKKMQFIGVDLTINSHNDLVITGYSTWGIFPRNQGPPWASVDQYVIVFKENGALSGEYKWDTYSSQYMETICVDDRIFVLYRDNPQNGSYMLHLRKIENGILSSELDLDQGYFFGTRYFQTRSMLVWSNTHLIIAGFKNAEGRIFTKIDMASMSTEVTNASDILFTNMNHIHKINDNELLIGGNRFLGQDMMMRYNLTTRSVIWSRYYEEKSEIYKYVFDADSSKVYTVGIKDDSTMVRSVRLSDGEEIWRYAYFHGGDEQYKDIPIDIDIDLEKGLLFLVGRTKLKQDSHVPGAYNSLFIHTLSTEGDFADLISHNGEFGEENMAAVVKNFPGENLLLAGGGLNRDKHQKGFIYGIDTEECKFSINSVIKRSGDQLFVKETDAEYQWINCSSNSPITGEVNQTFEPKASGVYSVKINQFGCEEISECYVFMFTITGVENPARLIRVFPNPAQGKINIDLNDYYGNASIKIIATTGKSLFEKQLPDSDKNHEIDVDFLQPGLYILSISVQSEFHTFKIVKD